MHKPDWVGDRKLGYCTVSVTVSRYLCELEGLARGRLRTGHCCRKRQGIYSFAQNSLPACKRLGERVSVKDDRSTRTVNVNMVMVCQLRRLSQPAAWRQAHQLLPARSPELQNSQRQQRFHPRIHPHATIVCNSL